MKSLITFLWMGICIALSSQENITLVHENTNGVSITYPVEIDMDSKREYERMTEKYLAQVNGEQYDEEKDAEPEVVEPVEETTPIKPVYYNENFVSGEEADLVDDLYECIDLIPDGVLSNIQDYGYKIKLVDKPDNQTGICGITLIDIKEIQIQARKEKFRRSVIHELGHAYDHYLGWVSENPEFLNIFDAEKESFVVTGFKSDGHYKSNSTEYFAEAFQMYIYDSATLKASAPQTYDFMESVIEE